MKKNIAVVGCGHWGKNLVRNFSELGALAAVCDPQLELAKKYALELNVKNYSFDEILNDQLIEGVVLAVPAPLHASMAIKAMNAGKHVYVEKPLSMDSKEANNMIASSKKNDVELMVGHLLQYHPIFIAVRKIVESNELGPLNYIYSNRLSFGKIRSEEDVIWSFAPHDISMVLSLAGQKPQTVRTESSSILQTDIADTASIYMDFHLGLKAHIFVSWLHPHKEQKLVVIGKKAMIVFDDTKPWNQKLAIYRHIIKSDRGLPAIKKADVEYLEIAESEPLKNECQHFIDVVEQGITPLTDGKEGLSVLSVLTAASLSKSSKKEVELN
jgi:UDP-2-acetamido-3-amino-2,3-dideoxy-glucuronate N-acetyltransferase